MYVSILTISLPIRNTDLECLFNTHMHTKKDNTKSLSSCGSGSLHLEELYIDKKGVTVKCIYGLL